MAQPSIKVAYKSGFDGAVRAYEGWGPRYGYIESLFEDDPYGAPTIPAVHRVRPLRDAWADGYYDAWKIIHKYVAQHPSDKKATPARREAIVRELGLK